MVCVPKRSGPSRRICDFADCMAAHRDHTGYFPHCPPAVQWNMALGYPVDYFHVDYTPSLEPMRAPHLPTMQHGHYGPSPPPVGYCLEQGVAAVTPQCVDYQGVTVLHPSYGFPFFSGVQEASMAHMEQNIKFSS